ncbi:MAG TPA: hypothetical protein VE914_21145, partial [Candidatus Angelobacter sp.]|nr:hypothetical protein [Candidatus Angelobacter sp.]
PPPFGWVPAGARMGILYVATSKNLASWAADVGLTKHVYKLGVAEGTADDAIKALNDDGFAGESDWRLLNQQEVDDLQEADAVERLARKEKMVDPNYYPKIRGAVGIFKVKIGNVANHLLVKRALAGDEQKLDKVKTADIAAYLIQSALQ